MASGTSIAVLGLLLVGDSRVKESADAHDVKLPSTIPPGKHLYRLRVQAVWREEKDCCYFQAMTFNIIGMGKIRNWPSKYL